LILDFALNETVAGCTVWNDIRFTDDPSGSHSERFEYTFLQKVAVKLPGNLADDYPEGYKTEIAVLPLFARSEG